jgi:lipopolysaccharide/colanic/teichoic acid biosynthesis glycosyltransferase
MEGNGASPPPVGDSQQDLKTRANSKGLYVRIVKPVVDRTLGAMLLVLVSPVIAVSAFMIWRRIGRPIFYTQERVGLNGETFRLYKLRTMIPDRRTTQNGYAGPDRRKTHKSPRDPRVVPVGRTLRELRFDELPQFLNVVKGDMSLVGPRPELPEIVATYEEWQNARHWVKPGLTGPWQISDHNGKPMHECTAVDLDYIREMSLWNDLRIIAGTPRAMIGGRKGY